VADCLLVTGTDAVGPPVADIFERRLEHRLHRTNRPERHQQPLPLEVGHDQVEAGVLVAEPVALGHEHVVEGDLGGVGRMPAELAQRARADARAALDDQEREPVVTTLRLGSHCRHEDVGPYPAGDERLGSIDQIAVGHPPGVRPDRRDVGARAGLGDRQGGDLLAP